MPSVHCLSYMSVCPVCDIGVLWPKGWMDQLPPPKKGHSPQFWAHVHCCQTTGWIKMSLGMEVGLGPDDFVLDGDPAPPRKKGEQPPPIFGDVYCGQTVAHLSYCWALVMFSCQKSRLSFVRSMLVKYGCVCVMCSLLCWYHICSARVCCV